MEIGCNSLKEYVIETELKKLCIEVIGLLQDLHNRGIITKEELEQNIKMKREFLQKII